MEGGDKICKYCTEPVEDCIDEGLTCSKCSQHVHMRCVKTGAVPGALYGDIFFIFTCLECSSDKQEVFERDKMPWLKVLVLVLYHLQFRSPGLGRKGFFHWRNHIASLIDQNWENLFTTDLYRSGTRLSRKCLILHFIFYKKKKKWVGTIAGTLSHFSLYFFRSGTSVVNEPAWWALTYPKLTPNVICNIYSAFTLEKAKLKVLKVSIADRELFQQTLHKFIKDESFLTPFLNLDPSTLGQPLEKMQENEINNSPSSSSSSGKRVDLNNKRKSLLPTFESTSKKLLKMSKNSSINNFEDELAMHCPRQNQDISYNHQNEQKNESGNNKEEIRVLDPLCHYNTSLSGVNHLSCSMMKMRLMGGFRKELILSPYSCIYLKPFIRRDTETYPDWLKLMTEIQLKANKNNENYKLPPRAPIDYTYLQPEHIPAINSLCNHFFWPGIDLTDCLRYPDFSCVVMYKKLIIGFAFIVPNVTYTENYISFVFTRPGWRKAGIGKFMIYHLIQTSMGKDITLHVSINNPALFIYQRFGFKVESVALDFYSKYIRGDSKDSKHAFFCRLDR